MPPGASTRANSASIRGCSADGRCSIVSNETTTSTLASGSGRLVTEAAANDRFARVR